MVVPILLPFAVKRTEAVNFRGGEGRYIDTRWIEPHMTNPTPTSLLVCNVEDDSTVKKLESPGDAQYPSVERLFPLKLTRRRQDFVEVGRH